MNARPKKFLLALPSAVFALLMLGGGQTIAQKIDLNANGMSDVWEELYGAAALDLNADTDGDGVPNLFEALAGTDPFDSNSFPQIAIGAYLGDHFTVPDPGQAPLNVGTITISRGGFPLRSLTVDLAPVGSGPGIALELVDHAALPRSVILPAGISSQTFPVTPLANTNRMTSVIATLQL